MFRSAFLIKSMVCALRSGQVLLLPLSTFISSSGLEAPSTSDDLIPGRLSYAYSPENNGLPYLSSREIQNRKYLSKYNQELAGWQEPMSLIPIGVMTLILGSLLGYFIERLGRGGGDDESGE